MLPESQYSPANSRKKRRGYQQEATDNEEKSNHQLTVLLRVLSLGLTLLFSGTVIEKLINLEHIRRL